MITNIQIQNFRSIQKDEIRLEPLTVIVGANSTGKSNLIKALDFISDVIEYGIHDAVYQRGGFNEILPKNIKNLPGLEIYFKIEIELDPPNNWPTEFGKLVSIYELGIEQNQRGKIKIKREALEVRSILLLSFFLDKKWQSKENKNKVEKNIMNLSNLQNSNFKINRIKLGKLSYETNVDFNSDQYQLLISWLGLKGFFDSKTELKSNPHDFEKLLGNLLNTVRPGKENADLPILSIERVFFGISPQLRKIISELDSISRYDLFINELRQEQVISNSSRVSITGDNIPSVVKSFVKEEKEAWKRISRTMSNISPYFLKVHAESLRAGKEYLVFEEVFKGRPIESWEASDGTLRALAILLCLESHKEGSTVLIEEPEHGLHPWAVKDLMEHMKETIRLKDIQVIVTTHSQQVLECINQNELLVTERDESGTKYHTVKSIVPDSSKVTMGEIGALWTRGLLKGVPTSF